MDSTRNIAFGKRAARSRDTERRCLQLCHYMPGDVDSLGSFRHVLLPYRTKRYRRAAFFKNKPTVSWSVKFGRPGQTDLQVLNLHLRARLNRALNRCCFVYVIGLHAVQFGNNWMKTIPRTVNFGCPRNFVNPIISKLDKHVVLLLINYIASQLLGIAQS